MPHTAGKISAKIAALASPDPQVHIAVDGRPKHREKVSRRSLSRKAVEPNAK